MPFYIRGGIGPLRYSKRISGGRRPPQDPRARFWTYVVCFALAAVVTGIGHACSGPDTTHIKPPRVTATP